MSLTEDQVTLFECSGCDRVDVEGDSVCCGQQIGPTERVVAFQEPELEQIANQIFGISSNEVAVCKSLMAEGPTTIADLAEQFDYDRSTVSRHLDHLENLGIVYKEWQELPGGGRQYVYSTIPEEEVRRTFLYAWTEEALELTEELSDQKVEAMVEDAVAGNGSGEGSGGETTGETRVNGGRDDDGSKVRSLI